MKILAIDTSTEACSAALLIDEEIRERYQLAPRDHTRLILPGETERLTFEAPAAGSYPFVCTYPGHWRVMNGVMHVVDDLDGGARVTHRMEGEGGYR